MVPIGKSLADEGKYLILLVLSADLRFGDEMNAIVNLRHPDYDHLKIVEVRPYLFDKRLLKD